MSKSHFTHFQQFGGSAIKDLDEAIAKLGNIVGDIRKINRGKSVTPSTLIIPADVQPQLTGQQKLLINWDDKVGGNVLHNINSPIALDLLLLSIPQLKEKINEQNNNGSTPLDIAITNVEDDIINILEKYGAQSRETIDYNRKTIVFPGDDVYSDASSRSSNNSGSNLSPNRAPIDPNNSGTNSATVVTNLSSNSSQSIDEDKLLLVIKKSILWMSHMQYYDNYDMRSVLEWMEYIPDMEKFVSTYYITWDCDKNEIEYPSKLPSIYKQLKDEYGLIVPVILYKCGNKDPVLNFFIMDKENKTVQLISLEEENEEDFRLNELNKLLIDTFSAFKYIYPFLDYTTSNYTSVMENNGKIIATYYDDKYSKIYGMNVLYLQKNLESNGDLTSEQFNEKLNKGEIDVVEGHNDNRIFNFNEISLEDMLDTAHN